MGKKLVLFVCVHNSARSQMAQAYLNTIAGDRFDAESAGLEAGTLNPLRSKRWQRSASTFQGTPLVALLIF